MYNFLIFEHYIYNSYFSCDERDSTELYLFYLINQCSKLGVNVDFGKSGVNVGVFCGKFGVNEDVVCGKFGVNVDFV